MDADLDLLLTTVFCTADDLLPKRAENARRSLTDAEVVTLFDQSGGYGHHVRSPLRQDCAQSADRSVPACDSDEDEVAVGGEHAAGH